MSEAPPGLDADYFDGWYANMASSQAVDEITQRHLGLQPHLLSTSLLGWDGIAAVVTALRLPPGGVLVDLACGRAGEVEVHERPDWSDRERAMWEEAVALDPGGDPALQSLHNEGVRVLEGFDLMRRLMVTATAPGLRPLA